MDVVTLAEAKGFINIGSALADDTVKMVANGAEGWISQTTGLLWSETSVTDRVAGGGRYLWLPQGPIVSVAEVKTTVNGTVESSDLYVLVDRYRLLYESGRWAGGEDYWTVDYKAGYGDTLTVPPDLKLLILQLTARWFDNRKGADSEGASGHSISWAALVDTDMARLLEAYRMGEVV